MADNYSYQDAARARQQYSDTSLDSGYTQALPPTTGGLATAYSIMGSNAEFSGPNSSAYAGALQTMQSTYGNRALQRYLNQPQGQGMAGYVGGTADQGTSTISMGGMETQQAPGDTRSSFGIGGGMWVMPGETERVGTKLPEGADGGFGYWEDNPSQVIIPGVGGVPLHDLNGGFGIGVGGTDILTGSGDIGTWENEDGGTRYGGRVSGGLFPSIEMGPLKGALLSGEAEASIGNDGFTLGAGATVGGIGGTMGDNFSADSNTDGSVHAGLSEGPSLGIRGHWGDSDGDGWREYGFGFDAGVVSFDIKSEDILRTAVENIPLLPFMGPLSPTIGSTLLPEDGNLTSGAIGMAGSAMDTLAGGLTSALDWASPLWMGETGGLEPTPDAQLPTAGAESAGGLGSLFSW